jgi:hypothetical protein
MISEPLVLEGELEIDSGCFFVRTPNGDRDLRDAFKEHFAPGRPTRQQEMVEYFAQMPAPDAPQAEQVDYSLRFLQASAMHVGRLCITFEPLDGQGNPLILEGECGIDSGEFYIEGSTSGLIYTIFLRHFETGPNEEDDEDDYETYLGRFRVVFEPLAQGI